MKRGTSIRGLKKVDNYLEVKPPRAAVCRVNSGITGPDNRTSTHEWSIRLPLQSGIAIIANSICSGDIQLTFERLHSCNKAKLLVSDKPQMAHRRHQNRHT